MEITGLTQNYNIRSIKSKRQASTPIDGPRDIAFGADIVKLTTRSGDTIFAHSAERVLKGVNSGFQTLGTTMKREISQVAKKVKSDFLNIEGIFIGSPAHNINTMTSIIEHSRKIQK